jgi:hypothetical protein
MREVTQRQSNQSKKAEILKCHYQWQILKHSGQTKAKRSFTVSVKTPKRPEETATLKGTKGMAPLHGSKR